MNWQWELAFMMKYNCGLLMIKTNYSLEETVLPSADTLDLGHNLGHISSKVTNITLQITIS